MIFVKFDLKFGVIIELPMPSEYVISIKFHGTEFHRIVLNEFEFVLEATCSHLIIMSFISLIFIRNVHLA
jgi:hypothetical protein